MPASMRRLISGGFLLAALGCGGNEAALTPTAPGALAPRHSYVYYLIYLTDPVERARRQVEFPTGLTEHSPVSAASRFGAPIGGQRPGLGWTPPGIHITAPTLYDPTVPRGELAQTARTDASGTTYPANTYEWIGFFVE